MNIWFSIGRISSDKPTCAGIHLTFAIVWRIVCSEYSVYVVGCRGTVIKWTLHSNEIFRSHFQLMTSNDYAFSDRTFICNNNKKMVSFYYTMKRFTVDKIIWKKRINLKSSRNQRQIFTWSLWIRCIKNIEAIHRDNIQRTLNGVWENYPNALTRVIQFNHRHTILCFNKIYLMRIVNLCLNKNSNIFNKSVKAIKAYEYFQSICFQERYCET